MRIAVFGASGTVGSALLPGLAGDRDLAPGAHRGWHQRPLGDGGRDRPEQCRPCARGRRGRGLSRPLARPCRLRCPRPPRRVNRRTAAAARRVRQIVYLGGLGDESDDLSEHLQSRRDTERHLASGSVPVTTIRAGMVVGPGSAAFDTIFALVDRLPAMICPRWVSTPTQPIAITDIARYIAGVCGNPEAIGRTYDAGGPEVMTYRQMIERIARIRHRHPIIIEVPFLPPGSPPSGCGSSPRSKPGSPDHSSTDCATRRSHTTTACGHSCHLNSQLRHSRPGRHHRRMTPDRSKRLT